MGRSVQSLQLVSPARKQQSCFICCSFKASHYTQVEDLNFKLASQEAELQLKNQDAEALIAKIGFQTEKVSQEKAIVKAEEQKFVCFECFQPERFTEEDACTIAF